MKTISILLSAVVLFQFSFAKNPAQTHPEVRPTLIVELDHFGFRGDFHWIVFTRAMKRAFEEANIPYTLEFSKFPVKDYKGNPAIELSLNFWRTSRSGEREINFWATFVDPEGNKYPLDITAADIMEWSPTYSLMEKNYEQNAYDACQKLIKKLNTVW